MSVPVHAAEFPNEGSPDHHSLGCRRGNGPNLQGLGCNHRKYLGKAVIVVNRPGGAGAVGYTEAAQAKPDGYTLTSANHPLTNPSTSGEDRLYLQEF